VAAGYLWVRSERPLDTKSLTPLVTEVGTPCLVFATLAKTAVRPEAVEALATVTALLGFAAVGAVVLTLAGLRLRTYLPAVVFPNAGNLGLPVALYGFGPEGLGYAIVFFAISSIGNYTVGQAITAGAADWRAFLRMPLVYAAVLGLAASALQWEVPSPLTNTLALIGGVTIPLMLLMLGASLARLRVVALGRAAAISCLRIGGGACIGFAVAALFDLSGTAASVLVLQCSMPVAVYNYLFAQRWNNQPEEIAGLVVVSTFAAAFTIPALLSFMLTS
jgi:predicted permease